MTASLFIIIWLNYSDTILDNDTIQIYWDNDTQWTNYLLYRKNSEDKYLLLNKFEDYGFYRTVFEYRKIDITIFSSESYNEINYYDNSGSFDTNIPLCIDAIIEHENDYRKCFEEVRKLNEIKAKLKVLITYPANKDSAKAIIEKMSKGIKQSNQYHHENIQTEYLLILGYNENEKIEWNFIVFNTDGNIIQSK